MMLRTFIERDLSKNRQNAINIIATTANFAVTTLVGFFMSPYIVKTIGVEANGFVSLAYNFISYALLATTAINSMSSRFLMIAYYQNDIKRVERIYSSVTYANLLLSVFFAVVSFFVVIRLDYFLKVPTDILLEVKALFASIFVTFIFTTAVTSWSTAPYIRNKLYLTSLTNTGNTILKACLIFLLFSCFTPSVSYVGIATLIATLVLLPVNYYCKKILINVKASIENFSFVSIREIISSGIWNSISSLGNILIQGLDLLLANIFIDSAAMGVLAVAKTMPLMIGSLNAMIANVFTPSFIIDYAKKNTVGIVHTVNQSAKIISVLCSVPLGFLFVYGKDFYKLWQPSLDAEELYVLSCITILGRVFFTGMQPLFNVFTVVNKVRQHSLVTIFNGMVSCLLTLFCLKYTSWGVLAIAGVSVVCCAVKNLTFVLPFSAKYLTLKASSFFPTVFYSILCCFVLLVWGVIEKQLFPSSSWIWLIVSCIIFVLVGLLLTSLIVLSKKERVFLFSKLIKK